MLSKRERQALGAVETISHAAAELRERLESGHQFMATSCFSAYVQVDDKHLKHLKPFISQTHSPMGSLLMIATVLCWSPRLKRAGHVAAQAE